MTKLNISGIPGNQVEILIISVGNLTEWEDVLDVLMVDAGYDWSVQEPERVYNTMTHDCLVLITLHPSLGSGIYTTNTTGIFSGVYFEHIVSYKKFMENRRSYADDLIDALDKLEIKLQSLTTK